MKTPLLDFWDQYWRWPVKKRIKWRYRQLCQQYPEKPKKQLWQKAHRLYGVEPPKPKKKRKLEYTREECQKLVYLCPMGTLSEIASLWNEMGLRNKKGEPYVNNSVDNIIRRFDLHYPRREFVQKGLLLIDELIAQGLSNRQIADTLNDRKYPPRFAKKYTTHSIQYLRKKRGKC